jgi:type I restriction enzyme S subunit
MAKWQATRIGKFLKEQEGRYEPTDSALQSLKRLNKIDFSGEIHLSDKGSKTDMIIVEPGDLVISGINVSKGALAVYHGVEPITATIHYSSYSFDETEIDIEYFKRFLKSQAFVRTLKEQVKGGIKTEIKSKLFLPLEINLPDIEEQRTIVSFFNRVENEMKELSDEITHQQTYLKKLRLQILQEAIEGKLTADWRKTHPELISGKNHASKLLDKIKTEKELLINKGKIKKDKQLSSITVQEKTFDLPEGWVWCRLGEVAFGFEYGSSAKSKKDGKVPVLRMGNLQNNHIDWEDLVYTSNDTEIEKHLLKYNDLLFNRTNSRELVGKTALYEKDGKTIYAGYIVRFHMCGNINPKYTNFIMNSSFHRCWCNEVKVDALGQSNINATKLRDYRYPLAPIAEQQAIVERVDKLMTMIDKLDKQITERKDKSERLMQSVLREAFESKA